MEAFRNIAVNESFRKSFDSFKFSAKETRDGDSIDKTGYFGPRVRMDQQKLSFKPITLGDLVKKLTNIGLICRKLREVDHERSGNVTLNELEDIVKLYNQELS